MCKNKLNSFECNSEDKRVIGLNGIYCITYLKELINDVSKYYHEADIKTLGEKHVNEFPKYGCSSCSEYLICYECKKIILTGAANVVVSKNDNGEIRQRIFHYECFKAT